jgi:hypothetical protein
MKALGGFSLGILAATCLLAQNRAGFVNPLPITRVPPGVNFPAGSSALPGVQRTTGSVLYPGGGGPQIGIPAPLFGNPFGVRGLQSGFGRPANPGRRGGGAVYAYPVPVYVGGYGMYDGSYAPYGTEPAAQQPNVTVIMPPQAPPVIINQFGPGTAPAQGMPPAAQETPPVEEQQPASDQQTHYLIAFKDHTIYSAVAYWVDGDTLHYFTTGNTHNQVSISLIDRALTERLNRESGLEVKLPPAK